MKDNSSSTTKTRTISKLANKKRIYRSKLTEEQKEKIRKYDAERKRNSRLQKKQIK